MAKSHNFALPSVLALGLLVLNPARANPVISSTSGSLDRPAVLFDVEGEDELSSDEPMLDDWVISLDAVVPDEAALLGDVQGLKSPQFHAPEDGLLAPPPSLWKDVDLIELALCLAGVAIAGLGYRQPRTKGRS